MAIERLINTVDAFERVRARIADILATETASQQQLAEQEGEDPRQWALRVFEERAGVWSDFLTADHSTTGPLDVPPVVNVRFEAESLIGGASNALRKQEYDARFTVDCYGYGAASADGSGHLPGDRRAALEAQRAVRLVRNILMASEYVALRMRGVVGRHAVTSVQAVELDPETSIRVAMLRMVLEVRLSETSPQATAAPIGGIDAALVRDPTGEVIVRASWNASS